MDTAPSQPNPTSAVPPPTPVPAQSSGKNEKNATTGLVLGIIGLVAWFLPIAGYPVTIIGLIFSVKGLKSAKRDRAVAGLVLSILGLVATIVNSAIGAYLGATGQLLNS